MAGENQRKQLIKGAISMDKGHGRAGLEAVKEGHPDSTSSSQEMTANRLLCE